MVPRGGDRTWYFGYIEYENIFVKPDSQYLWAATAFKDKIDRFVGYEAPDGYLKGVTYNAWES